MRVVWAKTQTKVRHHHPEKRAARREQAQERRRQCKSLRHTTRGCTKERAPRIGKPRLKPPAHQSFALGDKKAFLPARGDDKRAFGEEEEVGGKRKRMWDSFQDAASRTHRFPRVTSGGMRERIESTRDKHVAPLSMYNQ